MDSSSSHEISDDEEDLDDIPLTLDYDSVYAHDDDETSAQPGLSEQQKNSHGSVLGSRLAGGLSLGGLARFGQSSSDALDQPPPSSRGRAPARPALPDLGLGRLPATPEMEGEPLPSTRGRTGTAGPPLQLRLPLGAAGRFSLPQLALGTWPGTFHYQHH